MPPQKIESKKKEMASLPDRISIHSLQELRSWINYLDKLGISQRRKQVSGDELGHESYVCNLYFTNIPPKRMGGNTVKQPENQKTVETNLLVKEFLRGIRQLTSSPPLDYRKTMRAVWIAEHLKLDGVHTVSPMFVEPGARVKGGFTPSFLYMADLNQLIQKGERLIDGKLFTSEKSRQRYGFVESESTSKLYVPFQTLRNWRELSVKLASELKILHDLGYIVARGENFANRARETLVLPLWFFVVNKKNDGRPIAADTGNFQHEGEAAVFLENLTNKKVEAFKEEDLVNLLEKELALSGSALSKAKDAYMEMDGIPQIVPPPKWAREVKPEAENIMVN